MSCSVLWSSDWQEWLAAPEKALWLWKMVKYWQVLEAPTSTGIHQTIFSHSENERPYLLMYLRIKVQNWRPFLLHLTCSKDILLFVMDLHEKLNNSFCFSHAVSPIVILLFGEKEPGNQPKVLWLKKFRGWGVLFVLVCFFSIWEGDHIHPTGSKIFPHKTIC